MAADLGDLPASPLVKRFSFVDQDVPSMDRRKLSEVFPRMEDEDDLEDFDPTLSIIAENEQKLKEWLAAAEMEEKYRIFTYLEEDPARLITEIRLSKEGGSFQLPFGGTITFPEEAFSKKYVFTVCQVGPSERSRYVPTLARDEYLMSEIILVASSTHPLPAEVGLTIPYYGKVEEMTDIAVYWRVTTVDEWAKVKHHVLADNLVHVTVFSSSMFCIVQHPRKEKFLVPRSGVYQNLHIHQQVALRVPKHAAPVDLLCEVQIIQMIPQFLADLRKSFDFELGDVDAISDVIQVTTNPEPSEFKWPLTVKVPLPHKEGEATCAHESVAIMRHNASNDTWRKLDTTLMFGKASVKFDTHKLGRFCAILMTSDGMSARLDNAMQRIHDNHGIVKNVIIPFLSIQEAVWTLVFDIVKVSEADSRMVHRLSQGFQILEPIDPPPVPVTTTNKVTKTASGKRVAFKPTEPQPEQVDSGPYALREGDCFQIDMEGDLALDVTRDAPDNYKFNYHQRLPQNYKKLFLEPTNKEYFNDLSQAKKLKGIFKIYKVKDDVSVSFKQLVGMYQVDISPEQQAKLLYVSPDPEEIPVLPPPLQLFQPPVPSAPAVKTGSNVRKVSQETLRRLSTPTKPPNIPQKEAKVLSGRSLNVLSHVVKQALPLAAHLRISDSSVTGMSFDALSNGYNTQDITYRVLLFWKRKVGIAKGAHVRQLAHALNMMGENTALKLLITGLEENRELTADDLDVALEELKAIEEEPEDSEELQEPSTSGASGQHRRSSAHHRLHSGSPHVHTHEMHEREKHALAHQLHHHHQQQHKAHHHHAAHEVPGHLHAAHEVPGHLHAVNEVQGQPQGTDVISGHPQGTQEGQSGIQAPREMSERMNSPDENLGELHVHSPNLTHGAGYSPGSVRQGHGKSPGSHHSGSPTQHRVHRGLARESYMSAHSHQSGARPSHGHHGMVGEAHVTNPLHRVQIRGLNQEHQGDAMRDGGTDDQAYQGYLGSNQDAQATIVEESQTSLENYDVGVSQDQPNELGETDANSSNHNTARSVDSQLGATGGSSTRPRLEI